MKLSQRDWALGALGLSTALWVGLRRRHARAFFEGKKVVITGGSRGLGLALAEECGRRGADLALLARDEAELAEAGRILAPLGRQVVTRTCDLTDADQTATRLREVTGELGRIDVLINNAGEIVVGPGVPLEAEEFERLLALHFWAPFHAIRQVLPMFGQQGGGHIVNIASFGGKVPVPHMLSYTTSKFALVGFSEGLQAELAPENIRVTTVCPGVVRTGSHLHAEFKGDARGEFNWFSGGMQTPLTSIGAKRLARRIADAASFGQPILVTPWQAVAGVWAHALVPNGFAGTMVLVKRLLPSDNGEGRGRAPAQGRALAQHPGMPANRAGAALNE